MLTKELAIVSFENGQAHPDRLVRSKHHAYVELASRMCSVYRDGLGKMRKSLHYEIQKILEDDPECPVRRIGAFCKLLDEWSEYDAGKPKQTAALRKRVFRQAAQFHPLVRSIESILDHDEQAIKDKIAASEQTTWLELEEKLFADIIEHQKLIQFNAPKDPIELLARYNVAQTQVALMDATQVIIDAREDWKAILRFAKLANLMHRIEPRTQGYRIMLDGPASVLRSTHRYGVQMAKFLPGLLACKGWKLTAQLNPKKLASSPSHQWAKKRAWKLTLDDAAGLQSDATAPNLTDSQLESDLMEEWQVMLAIESGSPVSSAPNPPDSLEAPSLETPSLEASGLEASGLAASMQQWQLIREGDILVRGQRVFFPDFTVISPSGFRVFLEIVGFWTPEYIRHKKEVLEVFAPTPLLLAIPQSLKKQWQSHRFSPNHKVIYYQQSISPGEIIQAIEENTP